MTGKWLTNGKNDVILYTYKLSNRVKQTMKSIILASIVVVMLTGCSALCLLT